MLLLKSIDLWVSWRFSVAPWEVVRKKGAFFTEDILENLFQMHVTVEDMEQNNKINYCKLPKLNEKDSLVEGTHLQSH